MKYNHWSIYIIIDQDKDDTKSIYYAFFKNIILELNI